MRQTVRAVLSDLGIRRLRIRLPSSRIEVTQSSPEELENALARGERTALILDPTALQYESFMALVEASNRAGVGLLLYGPHNKITTARAAEAARLRTIELLFYDAEDEADLLFTLLESIVEPSVPALVLRGLAARFQRLPVALQEVLLDTLGWRTLPASVNAVARLAGLSPRTSQRRFRSAGLVSCERVLCAVRLSRNWRRLAGGATLDGVATSGGFGTVRSLTKTCHLMLGLAPRKAARLLNPRQVAGLLVKAAIKP